MAEETREFETDSSVRGYHLYQENWTPVIGEKLVYEREEENRKFFNGKTFSVSKNLRKRESFPPRMI